MARVSPIFKKGKKDDPNNYRPISVIPVVTKICKKLVHEQLYNYLNDNDLLAHCQSGFRSLHSTLTALLEATENWSLNIDNGLINGVIFIDLKKAFDTIDHNIIIRKLSNYGVDQKALRWFQSYLSDRIQKSSVNGHLSTASPITCGVPQGSIIGPLLFLVYINDLPNCLEKASPRMYADDTSINLAAANVSDLENKINRELINLNRWLKANKLSLNIAKTEFMIIGSRQRIQTNCCNHQFNIQLESKNIENVDHTRSLGIFIDKNLSWKKHITETSKKIASAIGALKQTRKFICQKTAQKIYAALIEPQFDYCSTVWDGISKKLSDKLQKLQNRAARVITRSTYETSATVLLDKLGWEQLQTRRKKQKVVTVFKAIHKLTPVYLQNLFTPRSTEYFIRDLENKLYLAKPRTEYLKRSFSYSGALLWNDLPKEMRNLSTLSSFKREIHKFTFKSDSHTAIMKNS